MTDTEIKNSGFYSRLSIPTIARIERLMEEFDWKGRDVFLEDAFTVLAHVRAGKPLPTVIEEARQRGADRLLRIKMGEAHDQSSQQRDSAAALATEDETAQPDQATGNAYSRRGDPRQNRGANAAGRAGPGDISGTRD